MGKLIAAAVVLLALGSYYVFFGDSFDPGTLRNKRVLVTGASSGIGEQVAYYYSQHGARLVITARRENLLKKVAEKCLKLGAGQVEVVAGDMAKPEDRSKIMDVTKKRLGGLDHLILNHAIIYGGWWLGTKEELALFETIFKVNCLSYVDLASKALEMLIASRGNIGIVSSGFGEVGHARTAIYGTAKFALHGFFSSLRQELRGNNTGVSVTIMVLGQISSEAMLEHAARSDDSIPEDLYATPENAAESIVQSVSKRYYKVRHGTLKILLGLNDLIPNFGEDCLSDSTMHNEGTICNWVAIPIHRVIFYLFYLF